MSKFKLNYEREALIKEISSDISVNFIVPGKITNPDPIVIELINHFKSKDYNISYTRDGFISTKPGYFNTSITLKNLNRALLIIDTFVNAIKSRNHQLLIEGAKTYVKIKDEKVEIRFWEKSRIEKKNSEFGDTKELIPTDLFFIQLIDIWVIKEWGDSPYTLLEDKLAKVIGINRVCHKQEVRIFILHIF